MAIVLGLAAASSAFLRPPHAIQASPCRTASDTGTLAITLARHGLTDNDSAGLVALGLPFRPAQVSLVTDSATCQAIIDSYNAARVDTVHVLSDGYVVHADSAFVLFLFERVAYFDRTYRYLFSQSGLN
jgi:hypothetical protein